MPSDPPAAPEEGLQPEESQTTQEPQESQEPVEGESQGEPKDEGTGEAEGEAGDDPLRLAKWYDQTYGDNVSTRYASDHEFLRGVRELRQKIRERDEAAQRGELVPPERMQDVLDFLHGQRAQPSQQPVPQSLPTFSEFKLLQQQLKANPDAIPASEAEKARRLAEEVAETAYYLRTDPERVLGPILQRRDEAIAQQSQQWLQSQTAAQREMMAIEEFKAKNAEWMYTSKRPPALGEPLQLTPDGRAMLEEAEELKRMQPGLTPAGAFQLAAKYRELRLTSQRQPTRKTTPTARHRPAVAPPPENQNPEDMDFLTRCMRDSGMLPE